MITEKTFTVNNTMMYSAFAESQGEEGNITEEQIKKLESNLVNDLSANHNEAVNFFGLHGHPDVKKAVLDGKYHIDSELTDNNTVKKILKLKLTIVVEVEDSLDSLEVDSSDHAEEIPAKESEDTNNNNE